MLFIAYKIRRKNISLVFLSFSRAIDTE